MSKPPEGMVRVDRPADTPDLSQYEAAKTNARAAFVRAQLARTDPSPEKQHAAQRQYETARAAALAAWEQAHPPGVVSRMADAQEYRQTHRDNPGLDAFAQGATFGLGDEITELGARLLHGPEAGKSARDRFNASLANYRKTDPFKAYGLEFAGGAGAGAGLGGLAGDAARGAGLGVRSSRFVAGAVPGALQGMGGAEDGHRLTGGVMGGGVGGGLGMVMPAMADRLQRGIRSVNPSPTIANHAPVLSDDMTNAMSNRLHDMTNTTADQLRRGVPAAGTSAADRGRAAAMSAVSPLRFGSAVERIDDGVGLVGADREMFKRGVAQGLEEIASNAAEDKLTDAARESADQLIDAAFDKAEARVMKKAFSHAVTNGPARGRFSRAHAAASKEKTSLMAALSGTREALRSPGVPIPPPPGLPPGLTMPFAGHAGSTGALTGHLIWGDKK